MRKIALVFGFLCLVGCKEPAKNNPADAGAKSSNDPDLAAGEDEGELPVEEYAFAGSMRFSWLCSEVYIDPSEESAVTAAKADRSTMTQSGKPNMDFSTEYCPEKSPTGLALVKSACRGTIGYSKYYRSEDWYYDGGTYDAADEKASCEKDKRQEWIPRSKSLMHNGNKVDLDNLGEKPTLKGMTLLGTCVQEGDLCTEYYLKMPDPSQKKMVQDPLVDACEVKDGKFDRTGKCSNKSTFGSCVPEASFTSLKRFNLDQDKEQAFKKACESGGGVYAED